ncbi:unnamed protein product [Effrenium voratum]|uniref:C2 domain-containing protein n=1 Tax=Effrenium voratum TaxID=2562239 RepID=A0AA36HUQ1_9DINO|nr:unnamed protein product [Effrenium voratum]CAJ1446930.1 unnamed protein product [Effrenium voratum]
MEPMQLTAEYFDNATAKMQSAVDGLLRSTGKVSSAKAEIEIFTQVEVARRFMIAVLWEATDRVALQEIFGGDLARVCRVRAVLEYLETLKLTTGTQRLNQCMMACHSIEDVLADLGFSRALREMQELQTKAMASRFEAATAEARSGGALASPASAPVESVPETPTPSTDDVDALDDVSDASAQVAAPASTGEDFFVGAGEILEGFSDSDGTPEEEAHSFSKRLVDFGSGLASTAGYALSEARSRASEMAQRADRQLGISETFSRRRLVGTSEGGSGSLIVEVVSVSDLGASEYRRLGDLTANFAADTGVTKKRPRKVYVALQLGNSKVRSQAKRLENDTGRDFGSRHLLSLTESQRTLVVRVFDKRKVHLGILGDPLVGEGSLAFPAVLGPGIARGEVQLKRGQQVNGQVLLKYKLVDLDFEDG